MTVHATIETEQRVLIGAVATGDDLVAALDAALVEGFTLRLFAPSPIPHGNRFWALLAAMALVQAHAESRGVECWWKIDYVRLAFADATFIDREVDALFHDDVPAVPLSSIVGLAPDLDPVAHLAAQRGPAGSNDDVPVVDTPDLSLFDDVEKAGV